MTHEKPAMPEEVHITGPNVKMTGGTVHMAISGEGLTFVNPTTVYIRADLAPPKAEVGDLEKKKREQTYDIEKEPEKFGFIKGWNALIDTMIKEAETR